MRALSVTLCLSATVLSAQEPVIPQEFVAEYARVVETCFSRPGGAEAMACAGKASQLCLDRSQTGGTTLDIVECSLVEAGLWEEILTRELAAALGHASVIDSEDPSPAGNATEIVRQSQAAWLAFRDAECTMAYAGWGGGSMRNIAAATCRRDLTASRAFALSQWHSGI